MSKRIIFTFDKTSLRCLKELKRTLKVDYYANVIRRALMVFDALKKQHDLGFTELTMVNPKTKQSNRLVVEALLEANK